MTTKTLPRAPSQSSAGPSGPASPDPPARPGDALPLSALARRSPTGRLWRYVSTEARLLRIVVVYSIAVGLLSLAVPLAVQVLINTIGFRTLLQPVAVLSGLLLLALAASTAVHALQTVAIEHVARRFMLRVVADLAGRLHRVDSRSSSVLSHRFFETAPVDKTAASLLFEGLAAVLQIGAAMLLLAVYHPSLLGFATLLALSSWLSIRVLGRGAIESSLHESTAKYSIGSFFDTLERSGEETMGKNAGDRAEELARRWLDARARHFSIVLKQQIALLTIGALFSAVLLFVGGQLVIAGELSLGQLVAAELVTAVAVRSLAKLGQQLPKYYDLVTSIEKLGLVVDLPLKCPVGGEPAGATESSPGVATGAPS